MSRNILFSCLIGVAVFAVCFTLLGTTDPIAYTAGVDAKTVWSVVSGGFGTLTTLSIAWFNSNIKSTTTKIESALSIFTINNDNSHERIAGSVQEVSQSVDKISKITAVIKKELELVQSSKDLKSKYQKELLKLQEDHIFIMDRLDHSLRQFAVYKSKQFREFIMSIHELGFADKNFDPKCIKSSGMSLSEDIRREGNDLVGEEFIDLYYEDHIEKTHKFFDDVVRIFSDDENSKQARFQEVSERFMKSFLESLITTFIDYKMRHIKQNPDVM